MRGVWSESDRGRNGPCPALAGPETVTGFARSGAERRRIPGAASAGRREGSGLGVLLGGRLRQTPESQGELHHVVVPLTHAPTCSRLLRTIKRGRGSSGVTRSCFRFTVSRSIDVCCGTNQDAGVRGRLSADGAKSSRRAWLRVEEMLTDFPSESDACGKLAAGCSFRQRTRTARRLARPARRGADSIRGCFVGGGDGGRERRPIWRWTVSSFGSRAHAQVTDAGRETGRGACK